MVPVVVQPGSMVATSATCTRRLVVLNICRLLLLRLMCMTGRAARLPPSPCAKHMPLSRRGGPARGDSPEGGTLYAGSSRDRRPTTAPPSESYPAENGLP